MREYRHWGVYNENLSREYVEPEQNCSRRGHVQLFGILVLINKSAKSGQRHARHVIGLGMNGWLLTSRNEDKF